MEDGHTTETILLPASGERRLGLDSAAGNPIDNGQLFETSAYEINCVKAVDEKFGNQGERCSSTPRYNCHGLTFASRRTWISDAKTVKQVLREDGYKPVPAPRIMLGDVIVYFDSEFGDVEHSGLVVKLPDKLGLGVPLVCSKWGKYKELIHWANQCPYDFRQVKYYRIM